MAANPPSLTILDAFNNSFSVAEDLMNNRAHQYLGPRFSLVSNRAAMAPIETLFANILDLFDASLATHNEPARKIVSRVAYIYGKIVPEGKDSFTRISKVVLRIINLHTDLSRLTLLKEFIAADTRDCALQSMKTKAFKDQADSGGIEKVKKGRGKKHQKNPQTELRESQFRINPEKPCSREAIALVLRFQKKIENNPKTINSFSPEDVQILRFYLGSDKGEATRLAKFFVAGTQINRMIDLVNPSIVAINTFLSEAKYVHFFQDPTLLETSQKYPVTFAALQHMNKDFLERCRLVGSKEKLLECDRAYNKIYYKEHTVFMKKIHSSQEETNLSADYCKQYTEAQQLKSELPEFLQVKGVDFLSNSRRIGFMHQDPQPFPTPQKFEEIALHKNQGFPEDLLVPAPSLQHPEEKKEKKMDEPEEVKKTSNPLEAILSKKQFPFAGEIQCDPRLQTQTDPRHAFPAELDQLLGTSYSLKGVWHNPTTGNDDTLYLMIGNLGEERGVFQYCFDSEGILYHRFFGKTSNVELCDTIIKGTFFERDFPTLAQSAQKRPKQKQETLSTTQGMKIEMDPHSKILTLTDPKTNETTAELYEFG